MGVVDSVFRDLATRSFVAALVGAGAVALVVGAWWIWSRRELAALRRIPIRILVTGTRGKSSTVRLLHSALVQSGVPAIAKTTGTAARDFDTTGAEHVTPRRGQVSVLEILDVVHRSRRRPGPSAKAAVIECMAVTPHLIEFVAQKVVRPTHVVVTNALLDHLEEEGLTQPEIARSMCRALPGAEWAVTAAQDPAVLAAIGECAEAAGVDLTVAVPVEAAPDDPVRFAHPANVAVALAVTTLLGLPEAQARAGLARASIEPGDGRSDLLHHAGVDFSYRDIGAVNDTNSFATALEIARADAPEGSIVIGVLVSRWDRPLRALQFAGALQPGDLDAVVALGHPYWPVHRALRRGGWSAHCLGRIALWSRQAGLPALLRRAERVAAGRPVEHIHVIGMENEHDRVADKLRRRFRPDGGQP